MTHLPILDDINKEYSAVIYGAQRYTVTKTGAALPDIKVSQASCSPVLFCNGGRCDRTSRLRP